MSNKLPQDQLGRFLRYLLRVAEEKRSNAGYSGEWSDGGARELENEVKIYQDGFSGTLPEAWEKYYEKFTKSSMENDPSHPDHAAYMQYLELQKRFGDN